VKTIAIKTPFVKQLESNIRSEVAASKRRGIIGMSVNNLRAVVHSPSPDIIGAPRGPNARYYYVEAFNATALRIVPSFLR
jgi:hypothetical protein